ncbi:MAG: RdgB/HAM1 family non-canonical purine NTP pyrophosphatase [Clostridia bacterium]|nr:RdgB/HAM1 family non-canonical purine NTP pyrophosphatase [Clostridia bacterium]
MDIIVATHNMKKRDELCRILSPLGINVHLAEDLGIELTDVEETGTTFAENAFLKAESGCKEGGLPCVADDSGLAVDYLNGEPGVYSARYSGGHGNDEANTQLVLKNLEGVPFEKRDAAFVSAVCLVYPDSTKIEVTGKCRGKIGYEPLGTGGFGYDPVFLPEEYGYEKTMAQLTSEEKDKISHRGRALRMLVEKIGELK